MSIHTPLFYISPIFQNLVPTTTKIRASFLSPRIQPGTQHFPVLFFLPFIWTFCRSFLRRASKFESLFSISVCHRQFYAISSFLRMHFCQSLAIGEPNMLCAPTPLVNGMTSRTLAGTVINRWGS